MQRHNVPLWNVRLRARPWKNEGGGALSIHVYSWYVSSVRNLSDFKIKSLKNEAKILQFNAFESQNILVLVTPKKIRGATAETPFS